MLANNDLDVDTEIVGRAENLDHAADRRAFPVAIIEHLRVDDHAVHLADVRYLDRLRPDAVGLIGGRAGIAMSSAISIHSVRRSS